MSYEKLYNIATKLLLLNGNTRVAKSLYYEAIFAVEDLFDQWDSVTAKPIVGICWPQKEQKYSSFVHIPWEYLGQPMNFSAVSSS